MNYDKLDEIARLLSCNMEKYNEAKKDFFINKNDSIKKYLGYEDDGEINEFIDFWYYYLADNTKNFFHNIGEKSYVNSVKRYIESNDIKTSKIDFEDFLKKQEYYSETLFDILISEVRYKLVDKSLDIFGINVGFQSIMYFILPKDILKSIKKIEVESGVLIFDIQKSEQIYGEIYRLNQLIPEAPEVEKSDFVEKNKDNTYSTLFDQSIRLNYEVEKLNEEIMDLYL